MLEGDRGRWGGELRRRQVFRGLAERTGARLIDGFGPDAVRRAFGPRSYVPLPIPSFGGGPRPRLAASDPLRPDVLWAVGRLTDPAVLAYYDDPIAQTEALGIRLPWARERLLRVKRSANLAAFRRHVVPSASFAELVGLEPGKLIVAGNGTDTARIRPGKWPDEPTIGMVSGAAPGRGIENLVRAGTLVRERIPELQLRLWLVATGERSAEYLAGLREAVADEAWIRIGSADYDDLGSALSQATVLAIPHPPGDYMDVALPVKLYDSMAAGRPLVVTPRTETRALVERHGAGLVAAGDAPEDLAGALVTVLADSTLARQLGLAARVAAEREFDWAIVGDRVASAILEREGGH
jgi:glycosyltransferase involved in cell wall biosynthesis